VTGWVPFTPRSIAFLIASGTSLAAGFICLVVGMRKLDRFLGCVELLASHTPETLPPRRTLTILSGD